MSSSAGNLEIKNAFRRLAKIYHPDKNPNGKEHFTKILKAYEILSDPIQKSTYDYRLRYQSTSNYDAKETTTKTWKFDEKELKRRQYYNDYIKKQSKEAENFETEKKRGYSDYKYIFFATPLAVALFLSIMKLATPERTLPNRPNSSKMNDQKSAKGTTLKTGAAVYNSFFGPQYFDSIQNRRLKILNKTHADIIICLASKEKFLRSAFIEKSDSLEIAALPENPVTIKYCSGLNFNPTKKMSGTFIDGIFDDSLHFYKEISPIKLRQKKQLVLQNDRKGFFEIKTDEFFKKN